MRLLQAQQDDGPPWSLWMVIWLTSGLLLACAIIYDVAELSYPFIGEIGTSSEPLQQVVQQLMHVA